MNYKHIIAAFFLPIIFAACSGGNSSPDAIIVQPTTANNDKKIFEQKCITCHGNDGTAGIGNAANLQTSKLDNAITIQTITNGRGAMPAFKTRLTEAEIQNLASYIATLRK